MTARSRNIITIITIITLLKSYISYVLSGSGLTAEERNCTLSDKYEIALTDEDNRRLNDMVSLMESFYLGYENCKRISETEGRAKAWPKARLKAELMLFRHASQ